MGPPEGTTCETRKSPTSGFLVGKGGFEPPASASRTPVLSETYMGLPATANGPWHEQDS
jgi:hypothetical protein